MKKKAKFNKYWLIPLALVLAVGIYYLPPVHSRLAWRVDAVRTQIIYFFNPPGDIVFQPSGETDLTIETAIVTARAEFLLTLNSANDPDPDSHTRTDAPADSHIHAFAEGSQFGRRYLR